MPAYFIHLFLAVAAVWSARKQYLSLYMYSSVIEFILHYKLEKCIVMENLGQKNKLLESHFFAFYLSL